MTTQYLPHAELGRLIGLHRVTGFVSDELGVALQKIAEGVWQKYYRGIDAEEFTQNCCVAMIQKLPRIDLTSNPFSYLTQCCRNTGHTMQRRKIRRQQQHAEFLDDAIELQRYRLRRKADSLHPEDDQCD